MAYLLLFLVVFTFMLPPMAPLRAEAQATCGAELKVGTLCSCEISDLRPTQMAVGFYEVNRKRQKIAKLKNKSPAKLEKYLRKKPEPVVIGPGKKYYITDHHHLASALLAEGIKATFCVIEHDFSELSEAKFWAEMEQKKMVYLFDEKGEIIKPPALPSSITALRDDPFRSLAGRVREEGGFEKSHAPFSEFAWANFFRKKYPAPKNEEEFLRLVPQALLLAKSPEAKSLLKISVEKSGD